ncbi:tRNA(Ile)(2)-agmatinylcytidine synthase [Halobacteriaceae archaeon SHR40]|uniref:TiaS agmantine-binding domain-containing protein n=1 Tax=Halovenus amylolytica TaxID=2500550 RepID=UPI000FE361DF
MTVIGLDDTDSRELGMCTTYVATRLAARIEQAGGTVERLLLVRCNPAVEHKTRGNAALAVHCELDTEQALSLADDLLAMAATDDERTNPGAVVADCEPEDVPDEVATFARDAVRDHHEIDATRQLRERLEYSTTTRGNGRGLIGALAAVGAWRALDEWTYECISYRERERWGTERTVDYGSIFEAADAGYPTVWDTVDREEGVAVCVPRTPCPILHGIRGDDPDAVREVAEMIDGEPVERRQLFVTNQGTDAHLQDGTLETVRDGRSYRLTGTVTEPPETREGGHVFLGIGAEDDGEGDERLQLAAFEPTKRFRDRVRALRVGDRITVCGELSDGTLKLEKFAVRDLVITEQATPNCPDCGRSMKSAGRSAGYRCRDCGTSADGKVENTIERELEKGWYEVPPCARRHIAKPLIRGGFDAPTHPEK